MFYNQEETQSQVGQNISGGGNSQIQYAILGERIARSSQNLSQRINPVVHFRQNLNLLQNKREN